MSLSADTHHLMAVHCIRGCPPPHCTVLLNAASRGICQQWFSCSPCTGMSCLQPLASTPALLALQVGLAQMLNCTGMSCLQPLASTPALLALQVGLAQMLKGGVIMDVTTPEEARIAEEAGAVAVMALERVPADIRKEGGIARMSDPTMIKAIKEAVTIPVMAKARIGHFVEAQILEALGVDYIDESEVGQLCGVVL